MFLFSLDVRGKCLNIASQYIIEAFAILCYKSYENERAWKMNSIDNVFEGRTFTENSLVQSCQKAVTQ